MSIPEQVEDAIHTVAVAYTRVVRIEAEYSPVPRQNRMRRQQAWREYNTAVIEWRRAHREAKLGTHMLPLDTEILLAARSAYGEHGPHVNIHHIKTALQQIAGTS